MFRELVRVYNDVLVFDPSLVTEATTEAVEKGSSVDVNSTLAVVCIALIIGVIALIRRRLLQ